LDQALRNALLELIQIDAAIGNWYGSSDPVPLKSGAALRTYTVEKVIGEHLSRCAPRPRFYWLPDPDLPGLAIACVMESEEIPEFALGLGCDLQLSRAMYKAFLESVAVAKLAKLVILRTRASSDNSSGIDPERIYDLDTNVAYYARTGSAIVQAKFGDKPGVSPSEIPQDVDLGIKGDLRHLVDGFTNTHKQLVFLDLTTEDVRELGFRVARVWSPDTLTLSLPSAPPVMHRRFQAYGGVTNEAPHPYA
jgi:hypothetical protein